MYKIRILGLIIFICAVTNACSTAANKNTASQTEAGETAPEPNKIVKKESPVESKPAPLPTPSKVWVAKSDGSKSCGMAPGISPKAAAKELKKNEVNVYSFRKGSDGLMHTMQCGGSTGVTVEMLIDFKDLTKAQQQGYQPLLPQPN